MYRKPINIVWLEARTLSPVDCCNDKLTYPIFQPCKDFSLVYHPMSIRSPPAPSQITCSLSWTPHRCACLRLLLTETFGRIETFLFGLTKEGLLSQELELRSKLLSLHIYYKLIR
jgi:hypothetical protein